MKQYNICSEPDLNESQINKLSISRKLQNRSSNVYETLKCSLDHSLRQQILVQRKIYDFKSQRELESTVRQLLLPCRHQTDGCQHDQLFENNAQGKCLRQLCEFRIDLQKKIKALEVDFSRYVIRRRIHPVEQVSNDNMKIIILEAINKKESSVRLMSELAHKEPIYRESAKRLAILCKSRLDCQEEILCQFEDVQNRKRYSQQPSFWSSLDCSCNINTQ